MSLVHGILPILFFSNENQHQISSFPPEIIPNDHASQPHRNPLLLQ